MILVTGAAGYIGSHTVVELLSSGQDLVLLDNFCNSKPSSLDEIRILTGRDFSFYEADIRDRQALDRIFDAHPDITAVIHFAGLKAVGESCRCPEKYFDNNVTGTHVLLDAMLAHNVRKMVFSSSATVYGDPSHVPVSETAALRAANPYGETKLAVERMLADTCAADPSFCAIILRYFNPVGAHESGRIGEDPNGPANNLMPNIARAAAGQIPCVHIFGDDYPTPDGTGVRDYLHVVDLARGHIAALQISAAGTHIYNLGTGKGHSVRELIRAFEQACGHAIPTVIDPRRPGDVAEYYADPAKAERELGWKAERTLLQMCEDSWRFITRRSSD